jgi:peptidoglycan/xylan/chitin deacetylase (PgdA/CDA1 family)
VPTGRRADPEIPGPPRLTAEPGGPFGARMTTGTGDVALTFDDGPDPRYTPQVLALLRRYRVKATFCLVGGNAQRYPDLVRAIAADGHTLCNHSWSHDLTLGRRTPEEIRAELLATTRAIQAAAPGRQVRYFRTPGGNWTADVVAVAEGLGMTPLHWDVDPRDWSLPGVGKVVASVTDGTAAGSVVLMHDGGGDRQPSVNALGLILPDLTRRFTLTALPTGDPVVPAGPAPAVPGGR